MVGFEGQAKAGAMTTHVSLKRVVSALVRDRSLQISTALQALARQDNVDVSVTVRPNSSNGAGGKTDLLLSAPELQKLEFGSWDQPSGGAVSRWLGQIKSSRFS